MNKRSAVIVFAMMMTCLLCACGNGKKISPTAKPVPTAASSTPVVEAEKPDKIDDPTPTPLMDTDQMIEDAKEDMDEMVDGDKSEVDAENEKVKSGNEENKLVG